MEATEVEAENVDEDNEDVEEMQIPQNLEYNKKKRK